MVPPARCTDLDHIAGHVSPAGIQPGQLAGGRDATTMGRQPGPEHICHMGDLVVLAYRTGLRGRGPTLHGISSEHGLGVTEDLSSDVAPAPAVQGRLASQPVVHVCRPTGRQQAFRDLSRLTGSPTCHSATIGDHREPPWSDPANRSAGGPGGPPVQQPLSHIARVHPPLAKAKLGQPTQRLTDLPTGLQPE